MKINHLKRYLIGIAMTAFLALLAGNAFGAPATDTVADRGGTSGGGTYSNNFMVVSPYWQVMGGESYTFIAVSHSSLSGMASRIGVKLNAITSTGAAYATAATFTVASGGTERVFVVPTNHATINSTNISSAVFLSGTSDFTFGHIRVSPHASHPQVMTNGASLPHNGELGGGNSSIGNGFREATMLTYWGSVIVEAQTTGFAMEFIGDMNDSQTLPTGYGTYSVTTTMASGVNLQ